jgi:hypothetical protein
MAMKKRISKGVLFSVILLLMLATLTVRISNVSANTTTTENLVFFKDVRSFSYFQTETLLDSNNNSHLFYRINFDNGSFVIYHVLQDSIIEVDRDYYSMWIFEAVEINGTVHLIYNFVGQIYNSVTKVYSWNDGDTSVTTIHFTHDYLDFFDVFIDDISYHVVTAESLYDLDTRITHIRKFMNGTEVIENHSLSYPIWDLREILFVDNQLFAFYETYSFNESVYSTYMLLIGITEVGYYNSTVLKLVDNYYNPQIFVNENKQFYLILTTDNKLSTISFGINETITQNDFHYVYLDDYYWGDYNVFIYENVSYISYTEWDFYYLLDIVPGNVDLDNVDKTLTIIKDDNVTLQKNEVVLEEYSRTYPYVSQSYFVCENGSYLAHYFSKIDSKEIEGYKFVDKYVFALKISTDLDIYIPESAFMYNLKSYSAFAYFWIKYWSAIVVPILSLGLIYAVLRKQINRSIKKMVKFLTRPIIPNVEKWKLVFINLWLFIKNASNLIFTLWKANKKRLVISLLGLTILASIIVTSTTLFDSKRSSLIIQYVESAEPGHDYYLSLEYSTIFAESNEAAQNYINENYTDMAMSAIMNRIVSSTSLFSSIIEDYYYFLKSTLITYNISTGYTDYAYVNYFGFQQNYTSVFEQLLSEGNLPTNHNEVMINSYDALYEGINVNDVITLNASSEASFVDYPKINATVTGIYSLPPRSLAKSICEEYNLPSDPMTELLNSWEFSVVSFTPYYLENFENISTYDFRFKGGVQFVYDFSDFDQKDLSVLIDEIEMLQEDGPFPLVFDSNGSWYIMGELEYIFQNIGFEMQTTQFLIIFLSIPILYLALFLTFEVNEIFSTSFEQEIRILSSKGVSTGMITFIYSTMKFFESLVATFLGFGVNILILPALLKINKFLTFDTPLYSLNLASLPAAMGSTFLLLVIISVPRIIKISKTKKKVEKPPRKFIQLMKNIRIHYILTMLFGAGLTVLSFYLLQLSIVDVDPLGVSAILVIFIYLMGIGIMIALLGLGLLLRDLHKIFMIAISKTAWAIKRNLFSFSLVEIRSDIKLFNNTFLTYLILASLVIPFTVSPMLIQEKSVTEAYFYGGSDLYVTNWNDYNASLAADVLAYPEVESLTNVTHLYGSYHFSNFEIYLLNDSDDFLSTSYKPKKSMFDNWDSSVEQLNNSQNMLVSDSFKEYIAGGEDVYYFIREDPVNDTLIEFSLINTFDYFPIVYDDGPLDENNPYYSERGFALVMTMDNFKLIADLIEISLISFERLLINISDKANPEDVTTKIKTDLGIEVLSSAEIADVILFTLIPFYSVLVAEFVFGILICIAAVVFTSLSNPLKILQRRIVKHDILKKIGIPTNRIIFLSAFEIFLACILPGLALGAGGGYGLLSLFSWIFVNPPYVDSLPINIAIPYYVGLVIFLGIPLLFYSIFVVSMSRNFAKYRPKNLE